jgi:hypothetical protein
MPPKPDLATSLASALVNPIVCGKAIFPLKVQPCEASVVFGDIQHLVLTVDGDEGYRRLGMGLLERDSDPRGVFTWDPERPLYPGLEAFKEADAAICENGRLSQVIVKRACLPVLRMVDPAYTVDTIQQIVLTLFDAIDLVFSSA